MKRFVTSWLLCLGLASIAAQKQSVDGRIYLECGKAGWKLTLDERASTVSHFENYSNELHMEKATFAPDYVGWTDHDPVSGLETTYTINRNTLELVSKVTKPRTLDAPSSSFCRLIPAPKHQF